MEHVLDDEGAHEVVSSKLPWEPAKATAVVSLARTWMQTMSMASACVGLTLPGMMEARFVGGQVQLVEAGAWSAAEPADVVGNLHQGDSEGA